ncbi:MAG: sulfatase-like hydrolase/transferase, partial [Candidatus Sumerlaeota bacterium]|nr:sulfatase-like hydrolase/transferase [Candidatus Sumerlaeota bacterium]
MSVTRREFLAASGGLAAAATMPNLWAADSPRRRFNILFLMSDQHYAHVLGCAGNPVAKTPNLDALAAGGVRFAQAACVTPFCSPSRGTMVTGLYPHTHGILGNVGEDKVGFVDPCVCTENILFDRGWATAHFGKWHLGTERDLRCYAGQPTVFELKDEYNTKCLKPLGDAAFDPGPRPGEVAAGGVFLTEKMAAFRQSADKTRGRRELPSNMGRARVKAEHDFNFWLADRCIAEIEKNRDGNFMITCSWSPPHAPWICPAAFYDLYKPEDMPLPANLNDSPAAYASDTAARWGREMGVDNLREYLRCYYGQVSMIDACV